MTAEVKSQNGNVQPVLFRPQKVIWDWDNTLVWSWDDVCQAMNRVRNEHGLSQMPREEIMQIFCERSTRELFPTPEWFGPEHSPQAYKDYNTYLKQARAENGIIPLEGAAAVLEWCKEQGIPQFVVSNKNGDALRREARMVGKPGEEIDWSPYFSSIVGAGDAKGPDGVVRDKPARESVDFALGSAGLAPGSDTLFIGDSISDVNCANNSGCTILLLGTPEAVRRINDKYDQAVELIVPDFYALLQRFKECEAPVVLEKLDATAPDVTVLQGPFELESGSAHTKTTTSGSNGNYTETDQVGPGYMDPAVPRNTNRLTSNAFRSSVYEP